MSPPSEPAGQRTVVKALWDNKIRNPKEIIHLTGFPRSTVFRYVAQLREVGNLKPLPRPGRPTIITPKKRRHIGLLMSANQATSSSEITSILKEKHSGLE